MLRPAPLVDEVAEDLGAAEDEALAGARTTAEAVAVAVVVADVVADVVVDTLRRT